MNIVHFSTPRFSTRFFAVLTSISLVLSALPAAFFIANAATTDAVIAVQLVPNPTTGNDSITLENTESVSVTIEQLAINDLAASAMFGPEDLTIAADSSVVIEVSNRLNQGFDDVTFSGVNLTPTTISYSEAPAADEVVTGSLVIMVDDGVLEVVIGCLDEAATNHNPDATEQGDIVCEYDEDQLEEPETSEPVYGCLDETATNHDPEATKQGDVVCEYLELTVTPEACSLTDDSCDDYVTVSATKIVCTDESELPNWGTGAAHITATTAQSFVADTQTCRLQSDWEFEWAPFGTNNPKNVLGPAGGAWTTFGGTDATGVATTLVPFSAVSDAGKFWMREVLQPGYIPFAKDAGLGGDVSAELYCHTDVNKYDNYDRIDNVAPGQTYHCVAFNQTDPDTATITGKKWEDYNQNGVLDEGEPGIAEATICVEYLETEEIRCVETDASGDYEFTVTQGVASRVYEVLTDPWVQTAPAGGACEITNPEVGATYTCDFGSYNPQSEEEDDSPVCKAVVEARVMLNASGTAGVGDLSDQVILGDADYSTVAFGQWFPVSAVPIDGESAVLIDDPYTVTNFADPADKPGLFVSREDGTLKVALYGGFRPGRNENHQWLDARIEVRQAEITNFAALAGQFGLETHRVNDDISSNDGFDEATADSTGVDFKMWVDTQSDGFRFDVDPESIADCDADTPETMYIDGYVVGQADADTLPVAGWTVELYEAGSETDPVSTTTTDADGYYYFDVLAGSYEVHEIVPTDWRQVSITQAGQTSVTDDEQLFCAFDYQPETEPATTESDTDSALIASPYQCDFYNERLDDEEPTEEVDEEEEESGTGGNGGGSSTRTNRSVGTVAGLSDVGPTPAVLGASTTNACPFLVDYMQMGVANDEIEVMKLQIFLNLFRGLFGGTENPVTGRFGVTTDANVKAFQENYRTEVLDPWFERGIVSHNRPTGFVYKTTLWKVNSIVCPEWAILPEFEGETLEENIDLNIPPIAD